VCPYTLKTYPRVPRYVAFEVFLGTTDLLGGVATGFLEGIRSALLVSFAILFIALILSAVRGKEAREERVEMVTELRPS